ncbi:MAG TPA: hypothetical protein VKE40_05375, partial [Gemmataceae bacterium]|nr:hypothetical protein [Gemmataceae bacterium]
LHRFDQVEDTVGFDPITTGLSLPRGIVITGRVTDVVTGTGVPSRVFYRPLEKNDQVYGGYDPNDLPAPWRRGRDTTTDLNGRYKITVTSGPGLLHFQEYGNAYQACEATKQEIEDGIVDSKDGFFRTRGHGGMFSPSAMSAYKVIAPAATERTATVDVTYRPAKPPK